MKNPCSLLVQSAGLLVALVLGLCARAEPPNGSYRVSLPASLVLVDPSGSYSEDLGDFRVDLTLQCDGKGKITGAGTLDAWLYGVDLSLQFSYTGSISGGGRKVTRLTLSMKGKGQATYEGAVYPVTFSASEKGEFTPGSDTFYGTAKVKVCVKGEGCESETTDFDLGPLGGDPANVGCRVDLATDTKNKVSGAGTVSLENGLGPRQISFAVSGKHNAKRDQSTLSLKATDRSGAKVSATGVPSGGVFQPTKLSGKALGQTIGL